MSIYQMNTALNFRVKLKTPLTHENELSKTKYLTKLSEATSQFLGAIIHQVCQMAAWSTTNLRHRPAAKASSQVADMPIRRQ